MQLKVAEILTPPTTTTSSEIDNSFYVGRHNVVDAVQPWQSAMTWSQTSSEVYRWTTDRSSSNDQQCRFHKSLSIEKMLNICEFLQTLEPRSLVWEISHTPPFVVWSWKICIWTPHHSSRSIWGLRDPSPSQGKYKTVGSRGPRGELGLGLHWPVWPHMWSI